MKPIVTITLNPAVDLTVEVDGLVPGGVNRAERALPNAGGKGVNVAACAADWGGQITATGVLGRGNDGAFVELFKAKGITDRFIRVSGDTRTNIKIADTAAGETTDLNTPGLVVDAEHLARVAGAALGMVGVFSYIGAAIQEQVSGALIDANMHMVAGERIYDFGPAIAFWIGCSLLATLLATALWNTKLRD